MTNEAGLEFENLPTDADRKAALDHIISLATLQVGSFGTTEQYNRVVQDAKILRATLSAPRVPVIDGLELSLNSFEMELIMREESIGLPQYFKDVLQAARWVAELQKGV